MKSRHVLFLACGLLAVGTGGAGCTRSDQSPVDPMTFAVPDTVVVSLAPYNSIAEALTDERTIDWATQTERAQAITLAHAAQELLDHLALIGLSPEVVAPSASTQSGEIVLAIDGDDRTQFLLNQANVEHLSLGEQGFLISPVDGSLYVSATTRQGVLNGTYRLLEEIGFAWYDAEHTFAPKPPSGALTWAPIRSVPRVDLRGFWIYGDRPLTESYALWMARNRLNIAANVEPHLRSKLGIKEWGGGHLLIQDVFSTPGLFEEHPNWYGQKDGEQRPIGAAESYFNPSFANVEAANYFADRMIERLDDGDLAGVDILNIWPTDSRFNNFDQSPAALAIGNETDNLLHFFAIVAERFQEAYSTGQLSRLVTVAGISYFLTWEPPTNLDVLQRLEDTNFIQLFYTNERSFSDRIDADLETRDANREILDDLQEWHAKANLDSGIVEYYNYSVYSALGLSDFTHLADNYRLLTSNSDGLFAYMHPLDTNPGPRRLTNALLARLGWSDSDDPGGEDLSVIGERTIDDYFERQYEHFAREWFEISASMAQSVDNAEEIYAQDSLSWLIAQELLGDERPYSIADTVAFISMYRTGGVQTLPKEGSALPIETVQFRGLDDSLRLQEVAATRWKAVLDMPLTAELRERMESDTAWFEATSSRYRLMAATCDFLIARFEQADPNDARARMNAEIQYLESADVTNDTLSPVDQRGFLDVHRQLAALP